MLIDEFGCLILERDTVVSRLAPLLEKKSAPVDVEGVYGRWLASSDGVPKYWGPATPVVVRRRLRIIEHPEMEESSGRSDSHHHSRARLLHGG